MLHFYGIPTIIQKISRNLIWSVNTNRKEIYLTFDDGPIPSLTEYILNTLSKHNAKATFFCVGENISKYQDIFEAILQEGHAVGNHTFNHLRGWSTSNKIYLQNIAKCQSFIDSSFNEVQSKLFRPPHGQITPVQIAVLKKKYKIIMWDILAYDFSKTHSAPYSLSKIIKKTTPGSIVIFHDNYKAESKLKYMLPKYIEYFKSLDYQFKKIS